MILPPVPALILLQANQKVAPLFSVEFKDAPVRKALESLFKNANLNYVIDANVSGEVNITAKDLPFENILQLMLRSATIPLTYLTQGNVWIVKPLSQPTSVVPVSTVTPARPTSGWATIPVRYRTVSELSELLGGIMVLPYVPKPGPTPQLSADGKRFITPPLNQRSLRPPGIDSIVAVGNGSLLVQGDPGDVEQLKEVIHQLDVPIPSVECRIEVVSVSAGKKNRNMLLQAMETGKCGTEIKAVSKTVGTAAQSSRLDVTIKATPLGGNEFELETRWEASVPLPGAQKGQLVRLEKTFSNTRRVKGGATMMFGGVVLKEDQGVGESGQEVLFFLTLKPF